MKEWCSCPHLTKAPDEQPGGPGRDCWANYPTHFEQWSNWNDPDSVTVRSLNPLPLYQLCQRAGWKSVSQGLILPHGTVMVPEDILRSMWCFEQNKNVKKRKSTRGPCDRAHLLWVSETDMVCAAGLHLCMCCIFLWMWQHQEWGLKPIQPGSLLWLWHSLTEQQRCVTVSCWMDDTGVPYWRGQL